MSRTKNFADVISDVLREVNNIDEQLDEFVERIYRQGDVTALVVQRNMDGHTDSFECVIPTGVSDSAKCAAYWTLANKPVSVLGKSRYSVRFVFTPTSGFPPSLRLSFRKYDHGSIRWALKYIPRNSCSIIQKDGVVEIEELNSDQVSKPSRIVSWMRTISWID